jgi:hypothetical protein
VGSELGKQDGMARAKWERQAGPDHAGPWKAWAKLGLYSELDKRPVGGSKQASKQLDLICIF